MTLKTSRSGQRKRAPSQKKTNLGAATDDPVALANRAIREAKRAELIGDTDGLRQAAEKGWLAISSLADVAAAKLGRYAPGGASARRSSLRALEDATKIRRGTFVQAFELARRQLHGECFHGDSCPTDLVDALRDVHATVVDGVYATTKIRRKSKR